MKPIAVAIICKTPRPGQSKTRLCPPLTPQDSSALSACFIADLSATIGALAREGGASGHAVYTPTGSEAELRTMLPDGFGLVPQVEGDFGARLNAGIRDLLATGAVGAVLVNSDSPTLPRALLAAAVAALKAGAPLVLSPALDGGYTLIGLARPEPRLFAAMPWSTPDLYAHTLERAEAIGLPVTVLDPWYDVDDGASLQLLEQELSGRAPPFARTPGAEAPRTRAFLARRAGRGAA